MTQSKTDEKVLNQVGQLQRIRSFEPGIALIKNRGASIDRQNKSVLIAIGMAIGFGVIGDAQAAKTAVIESPANTRIPIEKQDSLRNITNPRHLPPDIDISERNKARGAVNAKQSRAEVPGIDYTKNPPAPLQMDGSKDKDPSTDAVKKIDAVHKLEIVDAHGKLDPVYLSYLNHFEEKPFSEIKGVAKVLRFVLIESSHKPISITVDFKTKNGTTALTAKKLGKNFQLDKDATIELTPEQSESLAEKIEYPELWKELPYTKTSADYSYWILETWDGKKYQTATQFSPKDGYIKELGEELLSLTDLRPADATKPASN